MNATVKSYGTLGAEIHGYLQSQGVELELPEDATVSDPLSELEIAPSKGPAAAIDGRMRTGDFSEGG